jgi:hypothetical protein
VIPPRAISNRLTISSRKRESTLMRNRLQNGVFLDFDLFRAMRFCSKVSSPLVEEHPVQSPLFWAKDSARKTRPAGPWRVNPGMHSNS